MGKKITNLTMEEVQGLDTVTRISIIYSLDTRIAKETRKCIQNIEDIVIGLSDDEKTVLSDFYLSHDSNHPLSEMRKDIWFNILDAHERIENRIRSRVTGSDKEYPSVGDLMQDAEPEGSA
jgi:hypothetical protein